MRLICIHSGGVVRPLLPFRLVLALSAVVPTFAGPSPTDSPPTRQSSQWFESIEPGGTVRVVNPLGDVYARFGGYEDRVEILATIQKLDPSLPDLEVRREKTEAGLEILAAHTAAAGGDPAGSAVDTDDRIDLVVFVPRGAALDVETRDGRIEVKGLQGDVVATTSSGDVAIRSVQGRVRARSSRGEISATLESGVTAAAQEFVTQTGDIEVHLWEDADMEVRVATSGEISTDFSMKIEHRRFEEPGKHGAATVGKGGVRLDLESKRGRVRVLRLPRQFKRES